MAIFANYEVVLIERLKPFPARPAVLPISYSRTGGQPGFVDFQVLAGFRNGAGDTPLNLQVLLDGVLTTSVQVHRLASTASPMLPDRQVVVFPPTTNQVSRITFQPEDPNDTFFIGPVILFSRQDL